MQLKISLIKSAQESDVSLCNSIGGIEFICYMGRGGRMLEVYDIRWYEGVQLHSVRMEFKQ